MSEAPKVLIVEDDFVLGAALERYLSSQGFNVVGIASSAKQAYAIGSEEQPAAALVDITLTGGDDGIDVACGLYQELGIRCIFATAHNAADMKARATAAQPLAWLTKPYDFRRIAEVLREATASGGDTLH